jgi:hypothetical protein
MFPSEFCYHTIGDLIDDQAFIDRMKAKEEERLKELEEQVSKLIPQILSRGPMKYLELVFTVSKKLGYPGEKPGDVPVPYGVKNAVWCGKDTIFSLSVDDSVSLIPQAQDAIQKK